MAGNSDALGKISREHRAGASVENPTGGVWPVGGDPVPQANTAIENAEPAEVPSGKIESDTTATPETPAVDAADVPTVNTESSTARRGTSGKAAPAKS